MGKQPGKIQNLENIQIWSTTSSSVSLSWPPLVITQNIPSEINFT